MGKWLEREDNGFIELYYALEYHYNNDSEENFVVMWLDDDIIECYFEGFSDNDMLDECTQDGLTTFHELFFTATKIYRNGKEVDLEDEEKEFELNYHFLPRKMIYNNYLIFDELDYNYYLATKDSEDNPYQVGTNVRLTEDYLYNFNYFEKGIEGKIIKTYANGFKDVIFRMDGKDYLVYGIHEDFIMFD